MAASKVEIPVLWAAAATKTLNTTSWVVSDEVTLSTDDWKALINARGDNAGTPAAGDEVELRILYTTGDLDTTRYDPDWLSASINTANKKFKIAARAKQGATRNIVLALRVLVQRGAIA